MTMPAKLTFAKSSPFFSELRPRVDAYFEERGISRHANTAMALKAAFWLVFTWGLYAIILSGVASFPVFLLLWAGFGFGLACIGFNIGHDAIHGGFAERPWVNSLMSWTFDMMGACSVTWAVSHNLVHHTYTNVVGIDDDIEPGPTLRFYARQDVKWFHRWQHIYAWPLYSFVGLLWMYQKDFVQILYKDPRTGKRPGFVPWMQLLAGKALHLVLMLALPMFVLHYTSSFGPMQVIAGYVVAALVAGFTLAIVFQMAHVVENVIAPRVSESGASVEDAWADNQMRTTANFGTSWLSTFMTGGLDHQIEHHLFPRICHIHYPAIAPIVKEVALKHGLPYFHSGTFIQALGSHTRVMKAFGRNEAPIWSASSTTADLEASGRPLEPAMDRAAE